MTVRLLFDDKVYRGSPEEIVGRLRDRAFFPSAGLDAYIDEVIMRFGREPEILQSTSTAEHCTALLEFFLSEGYAAELD